MKLNIVDKGSSKGINGADIPNGTVFTSMRGGEIGLYVKCGHPLAVCPPTITIISAPNFVTGHVYSRPKNYTFPAYRVVEELTAVVK